MLTTPVSADFKDWNTQEQRLYNSFITLQAIDLMQTNVLIECQQYNPHCTLYEKNKILGTHPSKGEAMIFKAGMNYMIFKILDQPKYDGRRHKILKTLNVISIYPVIHNEQVGLGIYVPIFPYNQFKR